METVTFSLTDDEAKKLAVALENWGGPPYAMEVNFLMTTNASTPPHQDKKKYGASINNASLFFLNNDAWQAYVIEPAKYRKQ